MAKETGMGRIESFWNRVVEAKIPTDLMPLPLLGAVAYLLFRHAATIRPAEGALLIVATAGLLRVGQRWWGWQRGLSKDGFLLDWGHRILLGERTSTVAPEGIRLEDRHLARALNAVIEDLQGGRAELLALRHAMTREWRELDGLVGAVQRHHSAEERTRLEASARLKSLGHDLKAAIEDTLRLEQIELNHRLQAEQSRIQGHAFRSTLDQLRTGLEHFETLLEELQDSFPRLRREEDALGRLADAGLRQGGRLALSVKGLVAHTPRLVDETHSRMEWLSRLRRSADGVRDQTEALARRLEGFRQEAQARIRSFGGAQGSMKELDHVAQQTGLLAVNAAILAQQGGGSAGMEVIGGKLRSLADQTAAGATGMERVLDEYQHGLERETAGLWDLQEVTHKLLADVHELLRTAGHLDHQGHDLERALETHMGLVDQARQSSEQAELFLHEVSARAMAMEAAHGRQWGVEAKITPERENLSRLGARLAEVGEGMARISQQNIDQIWDILSRHQEIRRTDVYRQVTSDELPHLADAVEGADAAWNRIVWARSHRQGRLMDHVPHQPPMGRLHPDGGLRLLLLESDALRRPEASALESWSCDATGQDWNLCLLESLRTESHRLALLALLKESPLSECFPGMELRIAPDGANLRLPHPYPALPAFLAGLRLELAVEPELWDHPFREARPWIPQVQRFIWVGPDAGGGRQHQGMCLAHAWVRDDPRHETFLPWLAHAGHRPPCPWLDEGSVEDRLVDSLSVRCLGLDADPAVLHPIRDRLLQAGAIEGPGGMVLCAVNISHAHPEALLLRLFQPGAELAGALHSDLLPFQLRVRNEVLRGATGDPYQAAWSILEDLHRLGWVMPLPSE